MKIKEFLEEVRKGNIDIKDYTAKAIEETKKIDKEHNYMNVISEELAHSQSKKSSGKLKGLLITVKDNICVKDVESTAGSKILKGYLPRFNATAIQKLADEGAIVLGKTSMDEFGFGSFNTNVGVGFRTPTNPHDNSRVTGGSSGGSAGITAKTNLVHASMAESTGGSIEAPASFCGVVGFCPTYGRVSRYGLISYANSLDKIGPMTKSIEDSALLLDLMCGYDEKDSTSVNETSEFNNFSSFIGKPVKGMKIGIVNETFGEGVNEEVKKNVLDAVKNLESKGCKIEKISLPFVQKYSLAVYDLLATAEASTNLACFSGLRYGAEGEMKGQHFDDYFTKIRTENFGEEAKRRIMLGTFARMSGYRAEYYLKATKIRTKIIEEYKKAFKKVDCLITPTMPITAPKFSEVQKLTPLQNYMLDILTVGPSLAGLPHASIPVSKVKNLPVGMQIISDHFQEGKVIQLGSALE
jgi:aspartyl-tRNA(Asn)/glutamyl-tRNA(Gln) amidotransferase subunit A